MVKNGSYEEALRLMRKKVQDLGAVASLLEKAHVSGDCRATYALATWYLSGRHFRKNIRRATSLLKSAANKKVPDALYDLAVSYEKGVGVPKDLNKAAALYLRAALHGEPQSVFELARCYFHGIGVERNRAIARVWRDRAEELGVK